MVFGPIKGGGWSFLELLTSAQMNILNALIPKAIDGEDGGTYSLVSPLVFAGAGAETTVTPTGADDLVNKAYVDKNASAARAIARWAQTTTTATGGALGSWVYDRPRNRFLVVRDNSGSQDAHHSANLMEVSAVDSTIGTTATYSFTYAVDSVDDGANTTMGLFENNATSFFEAVYSTDGVNWAVPTWASVHGGRAWLAWSGTKFMFMSAAACDVSADAISWSAATSPSLAARNRALVSDPSTGTLFTCGSSKWAISTDDGATWNEGTFAGAGVTMPPGTVYQGSATFDPVRDVFLVPGQDSNGPAIFSVNRASQTNGPTVNPTGVDTSALLDRLVYFKGALLIFQTTNPVNTAYVSDDDGVSATPIIGLDARVIQVIADLGDRLCSSELGSPYTRFYVSDTYVE